MAAPRKTAGMLNFERQLTAAFPGRKLPDGWIADAAHTGTSSHHPDDTAGSKPEWDGDADKTPDVRGLDVSSDLGPGARMKDLVWHLHGLWRLGLVVRYFIHDGLIYHVRDGFEPRPFAGDPHREHLHVTFAFTEAADDNTTYDYQFQEVPVALTSADKSWISGQITSAVHAAVTALTEEIRDWVGDVVPRLGPDGKPVPASDPNPTMAAKAALFYLARDLDDVKKAFVPPAGADH